MYSIILYYIVLYCIIPSGVPWDMLRTTFFPPTAPPSPAGKKAALVPASKSTPRDRVLLNAPSQYTPEDSCPVDTDCEFHSPRYANALLVVCHSNCNPYSEVQYAYTLLLVCHVDCEVHAIFSHTLQYMMYPIPYHLILFIRPSHNLILF